MSTESPAVDACCSTALPPEEIRPERSTVPFAVRIVRLTESKSTQWPPTEVTETSRREPPKRARADSATMSECAASTR
jgi:hypothetical protein